MLFEACDQAFERFFLATSFVLCVVKLVLFVDAVASCNGYQIRSVLRDDTSVQGKMQSLYGNHLACHIKTW